MGEWVSGLVGGCEGETQLSNINLHIKPGLHCLWECSKSSLQTNFYLQFLKFTSVFTCCNFDLNTHWTLTLN